MPNLRISELPTGSAITGTELVPVSQNGTTIQTTTAAIAGSISLNYPFLTVGNQPLLTLSRQIGVGSGLSITDGGATYFDGAGDYLAVNENPIQRLSNAFTDFKTTQLRSAFLANTENV